MRLQKLTGLEQEKLEAEYLELIKKISYYQQVLANERLVFQIIKDELLEVGKHSGMKGAHRLWPTRKTFLWRT
jgi:DNA gyrase subunit A